MSSFINAPARHATRVNKKMIEKAREVHVLDYIMQHESSDFKRVGSSYRLKNHPSLSVDDNGFYWHSREFGGVTALDYLIKVRNYDFVDAVCHILNEHPLEKGESPKTENHLSPVKNQISNKTPLEKVSLTNNQNKSALILPNRNKNNYKVIAYLQNRGINKDLIMDCINRGELYESIIHHNAVFLGKDEHGKTRFAAMRAISGDFKLDAEGSCKQYGFTLPPENPASLEVMLFESPIDCLSHQTLCKMGHLPDFDGWRLSLGGVCTDALTYFLQQHPQTNHCLICTDNDEIGNKAAKKIAEELSIATGRSPPIHGKDWNDTLKSVLQGERSQNQQNYNEISI